MSLVTAMAKARFLSEEESKEILHNTIIELSTQLEAMKAQVETSRLQIETLITQVHTSNAELQEVKVKNLETRTKFDAFVNALYKPVKEFKDYKMNTLRILSETLGGNVHSYLMHQRKNSLHTNDKVIITQDKLYGLITESVKAAGMDK